jgi:hypothetical protein
VMQVIERSVLFSGKWFATWNEPVAYQD